MKHHHHHHHPTLPPPLRTRHVVHIVQQICKRPGAAPAAVSRRSRQVAPIGINVLAQQRHLPVPCLPQGQHLAPDGLRGAALLRAAREGHNAVGALQGVQEVGGLVGWVVGRCVGGWGCAMGQRGRRLALGEAGAGRSTRAPCSQTYLPACLLAATA